MQTRQALTRNNLTATVCHGYEQIVLLSMAVWWSGTTIQPYVLLSMAVWWSVSCLSMAVWWSPICGRMVDTFSYLWLYGGLEHNVLIGPYGDPRGDNAPRFA